MVNTPTHPKISEELKREVKKKKARKFLKENNIVLSATWILQGESHKKPLHLKYDLRSVILCADFVLILDKRSFIESSFKINEGEIVDIANSTIGQMENELFLAYRAFRLTASNFGCFIAVVGRNSYPPSLFKRLLRPSKIDKVSS